MLCSCADKETSVGNYEVWGLDVSRHQNNIEWEKLIRQDKPNFVFLKATEGTMIKDPTYLNHKKLLEREGIPCGAYHFFGHRTPGKEQAKAFIEMADLQKGNLRPVLDIEPHRFMTDPKKSVKEAKAFCKEIKRYYGSNPIIYCSTHFYNAHMKKDFSSKDYILWIADYRGQEPNLKWTIWQHTERHRVHGIKGDVDRNVFSGDVTELKKLML